MRSTTTSITAKSWTLAEVEAFRDSVRDERLFALWLLSCYGLRRSEVLGLRWAAIDGEMLRVRRGRVAVGAGDRGGSAQVAAVAQGSAAARRGGRGLAGAQDRAEERGHGGRHRVVG